MFVVLTIYAAIPILVLYSTNQNLDSLDKRMPYPMNFPYNVQQALYYCLSYISSIHAGYVIISHFYAHDAILLMLVSYLCGQFEMLHGDIVRLIPECHAEWQQRYAVSNVNRDAVTFNIGRFKILQDMYSKRLHELSARHNILIR